MMKIAELAGVSNSTVSRVFRYPHLVRPETRERILQICRENRYVYNANAGDLARKNSSVVGLLIPMTKNYGFAEKILTIQKKALNNGFSLLVDTTNYNKDYEQQRLRRLLERQVAGLILIGFSFGQENYIKELIESGVPCVVLSEKLEDKNISYVGIDNFRAAYTITEYLISLKHRRIGLIIGRYSRVGRAKKRFDGYRAALEHYDIPYDPCLVEEREPSLMEGKAAMGMLMSLNEPPTAVFAASDWLAIGGLSALREKNISVPEDVSVAGFDDIDIAAYINPPLTTMRQPHYEMAVKATEVLVEMIQTGKKDITRYCLETDLIIRKSCTEYKITS